MKTKIVFGILCIALLAMVGCNLTKKVVESPQPELKEAKSKLVPWENKPAIKDDSHLAFYNEFEISVFGTIPKFIYQIRDGKQVKVDNSQIFNFKIPKETPGSLIQNGGIIRNFRGQTTGVKINFLDYDCHIIFSVEKGLYFYLETKATVVFEGKEYDLETSINSEGTGKRCRALYDSGIEDNSQKVDEVATGKIILGTQEVP